MEGKNFERELPANYEEVLVIDAKDKKFVIIMNVVAVIIMAAGIALSIFMLSEIYEDFSVFDFMLESLPVLVYAISILVYIVLHELTHGIAYKALTGEKLTFGLTFSVAYCGVPDIYVYRKTALISLLAPFTVFTILFTVLIFAIPDVNYKFTMCLLLFTHLGGCVGDLYDSFVFLTKLKDPTILMNDNGPTQRFYRKAD